MKKVLILFFICMAAFGAQVEVSAEKFSADEAKLISEFTGNVTVIKAKDTLRADKVVINFDSKRQPTKYIATGNVKVKMQINDKDYNASGDALTYEPASQRYTLEGNAFLQEIDSNKKVYGERIEVDQGKGFYKVDGSSEPARFIFQIEDDR